MPTQWRIKGLTVLKARHPIFKESHNLLTEKSSVFKIISN